MTADCRYLLEGGRFDAAQVCPQTGERSMEGLIAMLSHELRNPLAAIRNAVHLMRSRELAEAEFQWLIAMLDRQSAELVRLADRLLEGAHLRLDKEVDDAQVYGRGCADPKSPTVTSSPPSNPREGQQSHPPDMPQGWADGS